MKRGAPGENSVEGLLKTACVHDDVGKPVDVRESWAPGPKLTPAYSQKTWPQLVMMHLSPAPSPVKHRLHLSSVM